MIVHSTFSKKGLALVQDAVTDLVLRVELVGLSLLGEAVKIVSDPRVGTMCTDGRQVTVSENWLATNGPRGNTFDLLHEWLHIFLNHVARCGGRDEKLWNYACDVVVVRMACEMLSSLNDKWTPPLDGIIPPGWAKDMTAEEIYDALTADPSLVKTLFGKEQGKGEHQTASDFQYVAAAQHHKLAEELFFHTFTSEIAQAQIALEHAKVDIATKYGEELTERLRDILRGTVPWGRLLRGDLITAVNATFATYSPPNRRHFPRIMLPSYRSYTERKLLLAIDVSASVGKDWLSEFAANTAPAAAYALETIVVTFDEIIREVVHTKRPREAFDRVKFLSGNHRFTDVRPVFEMVDEIRPSGVAILTDAGLTYPTKRYPKTVWAVPKRFAHMIPWGKVYPMEHSW